MEEDRKQKGGKKLEQNSAFEIPEEIYVEYCMPHEEIHSKQTMAKRKISLQKIEHGCAKEWKEYRYVTPKYAKEFSLKPPCKRLPQGDQKEAHPSSVATIQDYPDEKDKYLSKLQKKAKVVVTKFNEDSADAATVATCCAAEASATEKPQKKALLKKPSLKPKASSAVTKEELPQKEATTTKSSSAAKSSSPPQKQRSKLQTEHPSSCVPSATGSASKSSPNLLKTKMTAGRGTRPSPSKVVNIPSASPGSEEYDDETLQAIIRNKQERIAQATGSTITLTLDPKEVLDFIDIWHEDPNTPIDDLKLPPGVSHMVASFINEAIWKDQQAKQARLAKIKKEKFLKQNLLNMSLEKLVSTHAELKPLTDRYKSLHADQKGVKGNFSKPQLLQLMNTIAGLPLQISQQILSQAILCK
ncbi:hypothetical protein ZWY2020_024168 [Hordeum vulgare]|nr:hypothetical protein ZWY2020_024168 [Hordeum vulgare]